MKVKFLGTAAAEGVPAPFCGCAVCTNSYKNLVRRRRRSSVLINDDLLIDMGPDFVTQVAKFRIDTLRIRSVLFTHSHFDHCYPYNLEIRYGRYLDSKTDPLQIYAGGPVFSELNKLGFSDTELNLVRNPISKYQKFIIDNKYRITPVLANHAKDIGDAFNFLLETDRGTLLYATDTGLYSSVSLNSFKGVKIDLIILDSTNLLTKTSTNHNNLNSLKLFKKDLLKNENIHKETKFYSTHFSHTGIPDTDETLLNVLNKIGFHASFDGLELFIDE